MTEEARDHFAVSTGVNIGAVGVWAVRALVQVLERFNVGAVGNKAHFGIAGVPDWVGAHGDEAAPPSWIAVGENGHLQGALISMAASSADGYGRYLKPLLVALDVGCCG